MPVFRNASIKMQFHILLPPPLFFETTISLSLLISAAVSTRSLLLQASCFSLYSLNNRTAASGRRRGVTSKRLFRKMQMRVPLFRPRMMLHPPSVIKRVREDNLRTEEIDVYVCVCVYVDALHPIHPFPSPRLSSTSHFRR